MSDLTDLTRRLRELLAKATPGPWSLWTSCSWRRFGNHDGYPVCEPIVQHSDNHPDLYFKNGGADGPDAALMALAHTIAVEYLALVERCERAEGRLREASQVAAGSINEDEPNMYSALQRITALAKEPTP